MSTTVDIQRKCTYKMNVCALISTSFSRPAAKVNFIEQEINVYYMTRVLCLSQPKENGFKNVIF
jgi:hypothetical protein